MSSKISTIYDALLTRLASNFPNHQRLPVVYSIESNPENYLDQGYALVIGAGLNSKRHLSCQLDIERTMTVVLTRQFWALELDASPKAAVEKLLLEDQYTLIADFEKNIALNDPSVSACEFVGDNGIEIVFLNKNSFLKITSTFRIRYFQDLS